MPLAPDSTASAQLAAGVRGVAWLVDMDFSSGAIHFTTAPLPVTVGSTVYLALGTLVSVANVQESAAAGAERLSLSLSVTNLAMFALAMGDAAVYRGRAARLYLQLYDDAFQPAGAPVLRWQGYMDKLSIDRKSGEGGVVGHISVACSRAGMARARRAEGLRLTDAQQQSRYPGDTGLRYVRTLIEKPSLWLSKRFQEV